MYVHVLCLKLHEYRPDCIEEWYSAESDHIDGEMMTMRLVGLRLNKLIQVLEISTTKVEGGGGERDTCRHIQ